MDYRSRIYDRYASVCKRSGRVFSQEEAGKYARALSRYTIGWLPKNKDAKILDLACGSGRTLYFLKSKGYYNISGVDISGEQVELARQVTDKVTRRDILEYLAGRTEEYDLILAQDIIEHLTKDEAFEMLEACHNALRPSGRLILSSPNAESPMFGYRRYGDITHEICFTPDTLGQLLEICNFEGICFREIGPYVHGFVSAVRTVLWACFRGLIMFYNLVEIGHSASGVYTRDFLISGTKPCRSTQLGEQ